MRQCSTCPTMWNSLSLCGAKSVAKRLSTPCWTIWLALDQENLWQSTPAVAPDRWVQFALHNPSKCCSLLPLDGTVQNGLWIESSKAITHPTFCGAKPYLTSMITWQAVYSYSYRLMLYKKKPTCVPVLIGHFFSQARSLWQYLCLVAQICFLKQ